jgi:hypothetical protein
MNLVPKPAPLPPKSRQFLRAAFDPPHITALDLNLITGNQEHWESRESGRGSIAMNFNFQFCFRIKSEGKHRWAGPYALEDRAAWIRHLFLSPSPFPLH